MSGPFPKGRADALCARLAERQFGVIARNQALECGMTTDMIGHRIKRGRWERVLPSVYRIAGASPSELQSLLAACLWGGPGTVAFGLSAGAAWDFHGGRWRPPQIACARWMKPPGRSVVVHRAMTLEACDLTALGALPVTTAGRTLIDMSGQVDERTLDIALDQGLRQRRFSLEGLTRRIDDLAPYRLPGIGILRGLVEVRDPSASTTDSELETLVFRWLRKYGFPRPVFQHRVKLPDYGPARLDFAYPDLLIGIEADSYSWHSGRHAFERDRVRISEFASLGWIIIQTTKREIEKYPGRAANRLHRAWQSRFRNQA